MTVKKTTILALSWRDIKSPKAGGAEVHTHEMLSRADMDKYKIYHFATAPFVAYSPNENDLGTFYTLNL